MSSPAGLEIYRSISFLRERTFRHLPSGAGIVIEDFTYGRPVHTIVLRRQDAPVLRRGIAATRDLDLVGRTRCGVLEQPGGRMRVAVFVDAHASGGTLTLGLVEGNSRVGVARLTAAEVDALERALHAIEKVPAAHAATAGGGAS